MRLDLVHGDDQLLHHPQANVGRRHGRIGTLDHSIRDDELIEERAKIKGGDGQSFVVHREGGRIGARRRTHDRLVRVWIIRRRERIQRRPQSFDRLRVRSDEHKLPHQRKPKRLEIRRRLRDHPFR